MYVYNNFLMKGVKTLLESTQELAENKLILLYVFKKIKKTLASEQITNIILENNLINYFLLKQYLAELTESGFLLLQQTDSKSMYSITEAGYTTLELFINRIPSNIISIIDKYLTDNYTRIEAETSVTSNYIPISENEYLVKCKIIENTSALIEITLNVATRSQAKNICDNWERNALAIYSDIILSVTKPR